METNRIEAEVLYAKQDGKGIIWYWTISEAPFDLKPHEITAGFKCIPVTLVAADAVTPIGDAQSSDGASALDAAIDGGEFHPDMSREQIIASAKYWRKLALQQVAHQTTQRSSQVTAADYEEVLADHRRLVRELDVALNGDGAAQQASLCDIVSQVKRQGIKAPDTGSSQGDAVEFHVGALDYAINHFRDIRSNAGAQNDRRTAKDCDFAIDELNMLRREFETSPPSPPTTNTDDSSPDLSKEKGVSCELASKEAHDTSEAYGFMPRSVRLAKEAEAALSATQGLDTVDCIGPVLTPERAKDLLDESRNANDGSAITVWKDGSWKHWQTLDAKYAEEDPDFLVSIQMPIDEGLLFCLQQCQIIAESHGVSQETKERIQFFIDKHPTAPAAAPDAWNSSNLYEITNKVLTNAITNGERDAEKISRKIVDAMAPYHQKVRKEIWRRYDLQVARMREHGINPIDFSDGNVQYGASGAIKSPVDLQNPDYSKPIHDTGVESQRQDAPPVKAPKPDGILAKANQSGGQDAS